MENECEIFTVIKKKLGQYYCARFQLIYWRKLAVKL